MKLLLAFLLSASVQCFAQPQAAFTIAEKDLIPEGIAADEPTGSFYLGSIHKRKIVRVNRHGKAEDFVATGIEGLQSVLGMKVAGGKLWACNNSPEHAGPPFVSNVHVFDLSTGKLSKKFSISGGEKHLFNDLVFTSQGNAYVTDSDGGAIYHIAAGADSIKAFIIPGTLRYPNGITLSPDEKRLIVSTGSGLGIVSIDIETKTITSLQHEKFFLIGFDGLYRYKNSLIGVQNVTYPESILQLICSDDFTTVKTIVTKAASLPQFDSPTTGVIAGEFFYFIANSQLLQIVDSKGVIKKPLELKETVVMRIKLQ